MIYPLYENILNKQTLEQTPPVKENSLHLEAAHSKANHKYLFLTVSLGLPQYNFIHES